MIKPKHRKKKDVDQRTAASKKAVNKRFRMDLLKKADKWGERWIATAKKLGLNPSENMVKGQMVRTGLKLAGAGLLTYPISALAIADLGTRAAKKVVTGYKKGGKIKTYKKGGKAK